MGRRSSSTHVLSTITDSSLYRGPCAPRIGTAWSPGAPRAEPGIARNRAQVRAGSCRMRSKVPCMGTAPILAYVSAILQRLFGPHSLSRPSIPRHGGIHRLGPGVDAACQILDLPESRLAEELNDLAVARSGAAVGDVRGVEPKEKQ